MDYEKILDWLELKLDRTFNYFENHLSVTLITSFILSLAIRLVLTPYNNVLREDAYFYLLKSLGIAEGDFAPALTHFTG